ncbi:MAG: polymerase tau subunit [Bacteroidetes bacterium]|jgi:DNA polymerase-3 subunit gamma/tau|nr:polymerase tau subunit [Bacteroidota bacterium]
MSEYIVTARKWRPMKFEDVAGQDHVTRTLRNALSSSRLAHAYLFSGPRGVGKTTTARLLAKAVNCANPQNANPDNACEQCIEITEGRSFDVQEIDGASNRGVEEIRNLRDAVRYPPVKCAYKVYIIDEVHMLTKEAFNALLKTLEEPPPHILFIFATTELSKVPATILSRCQRFEFRRISHAHIMENLRTIARMEGLHVEEDALSLIARRGDGSLRDAQSLFDQVIALCGSDVTLAGMQEALNIVGVEVYFRVTDLMERQDAQGALLLVDEIMIGGYDLREFLSGLMEHFRNLLVARVIGAPDLIETSDVYRTRYGETAQRFSVSDLLRAQRLVHGTDQALRYTAQPRFRLEADLVQLVTMPQAVDLAGLIDGIEELKKKGIQERPAAAMRQPPGSTGSPKPQAPVHPAAPFPGSATGLSSGSPAASSSGSPAASFPGSAAGTFPNPSLNASAGPSPDAPPPATSFSDRTTPGTPQPLPPAWSRRSSSPAPATAPQPDMPSSPAGKGPNEDEVRSRWAEYVAEVSHQKISVGAVLGATTFLGILRGVVRVGCADEFQASTVQRNREVLMEIFLRVFGVRAPIQAEVQNTGGESAQGTHPPAPSEEHPVVQALRRELGAEPL